MKFRSKRKSKNQPRNFQAKSPKKKNTNKKKQQQTKKRKWNKFFKMVTFSKSKMKFRSKRKSQVNLEPASAGEKMVLVKEHTEVATLTWQYRPTAR